MSLINISHLTFCYDGSYDNIFDDQSFQIDTDWKLGFTGRNGRGKTTFLNLLLGKYEYKGNIHAAVEFDYFPYPVSDTDRLTEDILREVCPLAEEWEFMRELSYLEVDSDVLWRPFSTLSNGERTKALLAALFLNEGHFLLIDEPTNHLDLRGRRIVSEYLNRKKGFILISHDRAFLDGCVDHILSINRNNIEIQKGNFSSWLENKKRQDAFEISENQKLKKEISRLEKTAREKSAWSDKAESRKIGFDPAKVEKSLNRRPIEAAKAKKLMKRASAISARRQTAIEEKSKLLKNLEKTDSLKITQPSFHKNTLAVLNKVSVFYGDKTVCRDISFNINSGERIALCGSNGSGKSSVLKLILGENISYSGDFFKASGLLISYVPQDASRLFGNLSGYADRYGIDENLFRAILRKLDFSRTQFNKNIENFSSGQKKKVVIARSLCEKAHIHIWDEPLNYIDVISRMQIEELINKYRPTMLFVEHDEAFCRNIADKKIDLDND